MKNNVSEDIEIDSALEYKKRRREACKRYREVHPDKARESKRQYLETHKEEEKERKRNWSKAHPEITREASRRHRLKKNIGKTYADNKSCALYLGVAIAERVLSKVFKDVQRMPMHNPGFDFICNKGYKIDVKSATINKYNRWNFQIRGNIIADYFLCILYKNRDELKNPLKIWLIPTNAMVDGRKVKDRPTLSMGTHSINKYSAFERVDKLNAVKTVCENSIDDL